MLQQYQSAGRCFANALRTNHLIAEGWDAHLRSALTLLTQQVVAVEGYSVSDNGRTHDVWILSMQDARRGCGVLVNHCYTAAVLH
jgi:hypothetical protein